MRTSIAAMALGLVLCMPLMGSAEPTVVLPMWMLDAPEFPAALFLPDGSRLDRAKLRARALGVGPGDLIVYDLETETLTARAAEGPSDYVAQRGRSLAYLSVFDPVDRTYHQPRRNEFLGGVLAAYSSMIVVNASPFLSQPLPLDELDSDLDGLSDLAETGSGVFVSADDTGTDPILPDSDSDGLDDGSEVLFYGTDPTDEDHDDDGLTDLDEVIRGTNPIVADTDGDGLSDGSEVLVHLTDALLWDSDEGGRSDGQEVNEDGTDPLNRADDLVAASVPGLGVWGLRALVLILAGAGVGMGMRRRRVC